MTVTADDGYDQYTGDGTTTSLAINFEFYDDTDILVTSRTLTTGVETVLVEGTHYTVTGGAGSAGNVVVANAAVDFTNAVTWTISRLEPDTVETNVTSQEAIPSATMNEQLDRIVMNIQELEEKFQRCLHFPVTDATGAREGEIASSIDRASGYLTFGTGSLPTITSSAAVATGTYNAFWPASSMHFSGTAVRGTIGSSGWSTIVFNDAAADNVAYVSPLSFAGIGAGSVQSATLLYTMQGNNTAKDVVLVADIGSVAPGEDIDTGASGTSGTFTVEATLQILQASTITLSTSVASGDYVFMKFTRLANDASDTAVGNMHLLGVQVTFTAT